MSLILAVFAAPTHPAAPFQDAADGITNAAEFVPTRVVSAAFRTCCQGQCRSHLHPVRVCLLWMTAAPDMLDKEARSQRQLLGVPSHDALASLWCR